jgi:DNA-binding MarR family transcriptional regulator/GNAT superfamily N-acetyltransferase
MSINNIEISDEILVQLRKIVRAMDVQSRQLQRNCALTGPQLVVLREIVRYGEIAIGALAVRVSLSGATLTGIVDRLEQRFLVVRNRNGKDRRQVLLSSTEAGEVLCNNAPPLMQEKFLAAMSGLKQWEQAQMLAVLSRLSTMMNGMPVSEEELPESSQESGFIATCRMLLEKGDDRGKEQREGEKKHDIMEIYNDESFPPGIDRQFLAHFLHEHLHPYEDSLEDIQSGIAYALSEAPGEGGFILLAMIEGEAVGALVMLNTGMSGYVPEHLLLFVAVAASMRGNGIGGQLIRCAQSLCSGNIKLHVEYDNPAKGLYERTGFTSKYADMRWTNESRNHQS